MRFVADIQDLQNPEYRWYHKKEMEKILPFQSIRNKLGLVPIDYERLRRENNSKIHAIKVSNLNFNRLKFLVELLPDYKKKPDQKRKALQPPDRLHFETRDGGVCYLCGSISKYTGKSQLHHINPVGDVTDDNIVTLCESCHRLVHLAMYSKGKWPYSRV